jgi:hypothetical protein
MTSDQTDRGDIYAHRKLQHLFTKPSIIQLWENRHYLFGNVKYSKEATDVSYAEFYDSNGEMVASYSNCRWISYGTKAENAGESELWGIYNEAWNNAAKTSQEVSTDAIPSSVDISV